jgi:hypothetical protein
MNRKFETTKNRAFNLSRIFSLIALNLICLFSNVFSQSEKPILAGEVDVSKWVAESLLKTRQMNVRMISDYTYKMRRTVTKSGGKTESMLFESYFPSRLNNKDTTNSVVIRLEENGVPLPEKKIEKQRREAGEKLEKMGNAPDRKTTSLEEKREKGVSLDWTHNVSVGLSSFLRNCQFQTPGREIMDGRETISLNFNRCDPTDLPANKSYLANLQGKVWFDALDKVPVRLEAWKKNLPQPAPGATSELLILFTQKRITEAVWFPSLIRTAGIGNEAVFTNLKFNWQIEFFDYKLSETEIKDVRIGSQ